MKTNRFNDKVVQREEWTISQTVTITYTDGSKETMSRTSFNQIIKGHVVTIAKIGIDTGVNTGIAVWEDGKLQSVESMTITKAMRKILTAYPYQTTKLYIEDARKWIGFNGKTKATQARLQGAGSVKRDAKIWEDWCKEHGYQAVFVKPMGKGLKRSAEDFKRITKWQGRTNEHSRDAAMIVYGR